MSGPAHHGSAVRPLVDPRVPRRGRERRVGALGRNLWWIYLVGAGVLVALFYLLPRQHLLLWTSIGLLSVTAIIVGIRLHRPRHRAAWSLLACAPLTLMLGDTTYNVLTLTLGLDNPFPSLADVFYLLTFPLGATGIYLLIRGQSAATGRASFIDAMSVATGLGLLSWVYLVVPNVEAAGPSTLARVVSVAYPLGDVLMLAMLARLVTVGGLRLRSMRLLLYGAVGLFVSDVLYGLIQLEGGWNVGGPVDAGWIVFYLGWGAAALHPSMTQIGEITLLSRTSLGRLGVSVLASVSLIAPAMLFAEALGGGVVHAVPIAVCSAALFLLVIARLWGIVRVHQQSLQRERDLRTSSERLVSAHGLEAIYQVALDGVAALTHGPGGTEASLYVAGPDGVECVASGGAPIDGDELARLWLEAAAGGGLSEAGTVSVTAFRSDRADRGMLVVRSATAMSVDTHGALLTLAAQVALALESATLAEDLRRRRSDEQFSGILQAASDIIVIVDGNGDIMFGTPSLGRNLGRATADVVGRSLVDLLHGDDVQEARTMIAAFAAGTSHAQAITDWHLRHHDGTFVAFEVISDNLLHDPSVGGILLTMRDVSERRALELELKHQAFHDALTGLPNRALFHDRVEHALERTSRSGAVLAMLMLDLDDFKVVNDTRGHREGDDLLIQIAARLTAQSRAGATVSRFGGDEFAVLVEDLIDVGQAEAFAHRALGVFAAPFNIDGEAMRIGASVGLVVTGGPHEAMDVTGLMRCADLALYAAKDLGKGQVSLYHRDLSTKMLDRLSRRSDLELAMDAHEFLVHYQPIVSIVSEEIVGCEALVRWEHPTRGLVPPLEFISLAEETGLIVPLGRWVLDESCAQMRVWMDAGSTGLRLSVNVSARELREQDYVDDVRAALRRHGVPAVALTLELTESIFALNDATISEQIRALRGLGIKIAMDDFGTGYSSLAYLQTFEFDVLKVDKSFVDRLGPDDLDAGALVSAIITLGHSLRLEVLAEGIERADQLDELRGMGCGLGQGYLFARPLPAAVMSRLLRTGSIHDREAIQPAAPR